MTTGPVSDPFVIFDTSDWRSVIENGSFKEGKHPWHFGRFPKKTEAAVVVHSHMTVLLMGLATAFRLWQAHQALSAAQETQTHPSVSTALLDGEGTARWRLRLKEEKRDRVLIFFLLMPLASSTWLNRPSCLECGSIALRSPLALHRPSLSATASALDPSIKTSV
ncbi:MAG TPA: hypothetical protein VGF67_07930 [Ktedonobacteraceae bacterium]